VGDEKLELQATQKKIHKDHGTFNSYTRPDVDTQTKSGLPKDIESD
jgi:hypothetical protein